MPADEPEKCTGILLSTTEKAKPEFPVGQEDLFPAIERWRAYLEVCTDLSDSAAVPEV